MTELAADAAEAAATARAEKSLSWLDEMGELGMERVRGLKDRPADGSAGEDSDEAFVKLTRVVRLTIALIAKIDAQLRDVRAGIVRTPAAQSQRPEPATVSPALEAFPNLKTAIRERKANAFDLLVAVSESEGESLESFEALFDTLAELLDEAESCFQRELPLGPTIEGLCDRLGLGPELSRKVAEGWSAGYLKGRPRFNPFPPTHAASLMRDGSAGVPPAPANLAAFAPSG